MATESHDDAISIAWQYARLLLCHAATPSTGASGARPRIMSEAFSAIIIVEEYVFADGMFGMIEASTTRRFC